ETFDAHTSTRAPSGCSPEGASSTARCTAGSIGSGTTPKTDSHAKEIVAAVRDGHLPVKSALDIGCSVGWAVNELGKLGVQASGVDAAPRAIEDGRK
ncbi:MAG: hypothetical protein AAGA55_12195, partial [Planctomycetota bacterium]